MSTLRATILGCGSSGGVPRIGGHWGDCDPQNPKNVRRRCSMLLEKEGPEGTTRVLIDASPDLRSQLLSAGVGALDGVVFTHSHADHTHGLDDLRMIVINMRKRLPVWADAPTQADLLHRFAYAFIQPEGSDYPPILEMNDIGEEPVEVPGAGGTISLAPFRVPHGNITALGFRMGTLAYLPDMERLPDDVLPALEGLDCFVVDALRRTPHPSHSHLEQTLGYIERLAPARAVLTNMHVDLDYETLRGETPDHIEPAFDGMVLNVEG
ncbi:MBL fold metallo-hydrolase [Tropicimonas sp. IMCC34011]|uniref:MBL fold metallo-hydrolase n=1 Tax=Tropicimonas sp. IMCC34011 TaxID=2248759 RepID=UPI000E2667AE|nr:MBL fold metallo-hydrolase [Tropicimonas sp. IMCC34011]